MYIQSLGTAIKEGKIKGETKFVTTRFGNVLGSNGSVIPLFRKQIANGGPVTITHPEIIRYFMTIPEACRLVLEAAFIGEGNDVFVFDMGEPVKILDLATKMIRLSGLRPNEDIKIEFSGLRPGEKLYEELLYKKETTIPTKNKKIFHAQSTRKEYNLLNEQIANLLEVASTSNRYQIVECMKKINSEFKSQASVYEHIDEKLAQDCENIEL
jgi:FlaA1/EpsC-like NDP-sugar epimerase